MNFDALRARTNHALPSLAQTKRALDDALQARRRPRYRGLVAAAFVAAGVLTPIPYHRTTGYDVALRGPDGHVATVRVQASSQTEAERRARSIAQAAHGTATSVTPHSELVWGSVYAMAAAKVFKVHVDTEGKSDAEVEAEVRAQLAEQGWLTGEVQVSRAEGTVSIQATDGPRHIRIKRPLDEGRVDVEPEPIDDRREPGMTDDGLRDKILRQLRARGMKDAEVIVEGGRIQIRAHRQP